MSLSGTRAVEHPLDAGRSRAAPNALQVRRSASSNVAKGKTASNLRDSFVCSSLAALFLVGFLSELPALDPFFQHPAGRPCFR